MKEAATRLLTQLSVNAKNIYILVKKSSNTKWWRNAKQNVKEADYIKK